MKVYHGTSYENYVKFMIKPLSKVKKNWKSSDDNVLYLYGIQDYNSNSDDKEMLLKAFDNGILCSSITRSRYPVVVVLEMEIDNYLLHPDSSDGYLKKNSWFINKQDLCNCTIEIVVHEYEYNPEKRWMYLYNLYHSACSLSWDLANDYVVDKEK